MSKANAEAHFKTVKNTVLRNETHLLSARFIRKLKKYSSELVHEEKRKVLLKNRKGMKPLYSLNEKKFDTKIAENESTDSKCDEIEAISAPLDPSLKKAGIRIEEEEKGRLKVT